MNAVAFRRTDKCETSSRPARAPASIAKHQPQSAASRTLALMPPRDAFIQRKCGCAGPSAGIGNMEEAPAFAAIGTRLEVSTSGDPFEREADQVADRVMTMRDPAAGQSVAGRLGANPVQRKCESCAREETGASAVSSLVSAAISSGGHPLDGPTRAFMEPRFGRDLSHVRIHTGTQAARSARAINASAYTLGRDIVFAAGTYAPHTASGRHLIAHEVAHVAQQSNVARPAVQRQGLGGPLDVKPDVCITIPVLGTLCGQKAAEACKKLPSNPGCDLVCKAFDCSKPKEPKTLCPTGWRAATSRGFEGQCCLGGIDNAQNCCTPGRIATFENRCCPEGQFVQDNRCKSGGGLRDFSCPFGPPTLLGECCFPPMVSKGLRCGLPDLKPPQPPPAPSQPMMPHAVDIFFKLDRPQAGETTAALASATTAEGKANFDAIVISLKADPEMRVQLIGRASPEGTEAYNRELGARRARLIAQALKEAGVSRSQIADPPSPDLRSECEALAPGVVTCGKSGATGAGDREVMARLFQSRAP